MVGVVLPCEKGYCVLIAHSLFARFSLPRTSLLQVQTFVCVATLVTELSGFFIKSMLSLEPLHPFNTMRLILWAAVGLPAVQEFHKWVGAKPELSTKPWEAAERVIDIPAPSYLYLTAKMALAEVIFVVTCSR